MDSINKLGENYSITTVGRDRGSISGTDPTSSFAALLANAYKDSTTARVSGQPGKLEISASFQGSGTAPLQRKTGTSEDSLHERALALRAYRQELIASNIANADTPNYKAVDIDVEEALRAGQSVSTVIVKYGVPAQPSLDGNTVEMDAERAKFTENTIKFEFSLGRASGHYKEMSELLKNIPY